MAKACMVIVLLAFPTSASAHQLNVFARVDGTAIRGKAYFRGGAPAQKVTVTALDPAGKELGRTATDEQGQFVLEVHWRCDHRLVVETPDGHGGEYTIHAAELPEGLPAENLPGDPTADIASVPAKDPAAAPPAAKAASDGQLLAEIRGLREQLAQYEARTRFRDVLGGIGYILGLSGVAFYVVGSRKQAAGSRQPAELQGSESPSCGEPEP